jgi:hypothetical protein
MSASSPLWLEFGRLVLHTGRALLLGNNTTKTLSRYLPITIANIEKRTCDDRRRNTQTQKQGVLVGNADQTFTGKK